LARSISWTSGPRRKTARCVPLGAVELKASTPGPSSKELNPTPIPKYLFFRAGERCNRPTSAFRKPWAWNNAR
jgi:hypothetical protein